MDNIIVVGSSGHALVVIDIIEKEGRHKILGLTDPFKDQGIEVLGYKILGGQRDIPQLQDRIGFEGAIIAVGNNYDRYSIFKEIKNICSDLKYIAAVHPSSNIGSQVEIGEGSVIMPGAVINSGARIGRFCIVNTSATIDHECVLEDFSSLAPGVTLGGKVKIGKFSQIALGAKVIDKIDIGEHVVVGAGAVVLKNLPENVVAYGLPAKVIKNRKISHKICFA